MGNFLTNILQRFRAPPRTAYGSLPPELLAYEARYDARYGDWLEGPGGSPLHASVELEVGRLWYSMVCLLRPARVLETGTWRGYSTCCIAAALHYLDGFDPFPRGVITVDVERQDHLWKGTSLESYITFILGEGARAKVDGEFDMLVLDSDHSYATISAEIESLEPRLRTGGTLLFHDSLYFDGVGAAVRTLTDSGRFEVVTLDSPRHTLDLPRTRGHSVYRTPGVTIARKVREGPPIPPDPALQGMVLGDIRSPALLRNPSTNQTQPKPVKHLPGDGVQT